MSFSREAWERNLPLYRAIRQLPFNRELAAGTLDKAAFCHYVVQDAHYLLAYGRALAVCAAKAFDAQDVLFFTGSAQEAVAMERSLHEGFMRQFGITAELCAQTPPSAACHHYISFITAAVWSESYPVAAAALLPCFQIYAEAGKDIIDQSVPDNPYQAWIDTYSGEAFRVAAERAADAVDKAAEVSGRRTVARMHQAYAEAARLEWLFWDSAYEKRDWGLAQY